MTNNEVLEGGRKLPLVEDFYTIQGEGFHTGKPAYFIRLGGCDVGCAWCDAKYTWNPRMYPPTAIEEIVERAVACAAQSIVITGGEPLLYPLDNLTHALKDLARTHSRAYSIGCVSRQSESRHLSTRHTLAPTS